MINDAKPKSVHKDILRRMDIEDVMDRVRQHWKTGEPVIDGLKIWVTDKMTFVRDNNG